MDGKWTFLLFPTFLEQFSVTPPEKESIQWDRSPSCLSFLCTAVKARSKEEMSRVKSSGILPPSSPLLWHQVNGTHYLIFKWIIQRDQGFFGLSNSGVFYGFLSLWCGRRLKVKPGKGIRKTTAFKHFIPCQHSGNGNEAFSHLQRTVEVEPNYVP